jgi:hypothetical protein
MLGFDDRGQGGIRALFFLAGLFLFILILFSGIAFPLFDELMPVISGNSAAQSASWMPFGGVNTFMSRLRMIALGGSLLVFGMSVMWVFLWYVRNQASVRA